jgi:PPOX class probable F420-dependent enzyme
VDFSELGAKTYIALETFRRNGVGVNTPVWVAGMDERLYVITEGTSWKVKRIRNNSRVRVAASDSRGNPKSEWLEGTARIMEPGDGEEPIRRLAAKYGLQYKLFGLMYRLRGRGANRVVLEISEA